MAALAKTRNNDFFTTEPFGLARQLFGFEPFVAANRSTSRAKPAYAPSFDVVENPEAYLIRADLPGVAEENVEVTIHKGILMVSGSREAERKEEGERYHLSERSSGSFTRRFSLPENANADSVKADLKDGILSIEVAKLAESKPRKIKVG